MRWLLFLLINTITLLFHLSQTGGVKAVISENLLLTHHNLLRLVLGKGPYGAKIERTLSSRFTIVEIEHSPKAFSA